MRPCHNPYGGVNPLIDKMIGNAYDVVKYVARHLKEIRYLAENMSTIYDVAHGYRLQLNGNPSGFSTLNLALPSGFDLDNINGVTVVAQLGSMVYLPAANTYNAGISGSNVVISINTGSSPTLVNADFRVTIYTIPASQIEE